MCSQKSTQGHTAGHHYSRYILKQTNIQQQLQQQQQQPPQPSALPIQTTANLIITTVHLQHTWYGTQYTYIPLRIYMFYYTLLKHKETLHRHIPFFSFSADIVCFPIVYAVKRIIPFLSFDVGYLISSVWWVGRIVGYTKNNNWLGFLGLTTGLDLLLCNCRTSQAHPTTTKWIEILTASNLCLSNIS